jgi:hypothetical protein
MLKYSPANAKTEALKEVDELRPFLAAIHEQGIPHRKIYSLDLLSGYSCPSANECLSKAIIVAGKRKIKDGPNTKFRCFSASQEVQYTNVYNLRKHNFDTLRGLHINDMIHELNQAMPKNLGICRIHVAGDFFNSDYMFAWINMAMMHPDRLFYAYTKSLKYWLKYREWVDQLDNFVLTASFGGRDDTMIASDGFKSARVVFSEKEAEELGLEIDHDDSHAARPSMKNQDFALLIHGTQPKDTDASEALKLLKRNKVKHSYNRKVSA